MTSCSESKSKGRVSENKAFMPLSLHYMGTTARHITWKIMMSIVWTRKYTSLVNSGFTDRRKDITLSASYKFDPRGRAELDRDIDDNDVDTNSLSGGEAMYLPLSGLLANCLEVKPATTHGTIRRCFSSF
jgi:hypothetical protein